MRSFSISRSGRNRIYLFGGVTVLILAVVLIAVIELLYIRHEAETRAATTTANLAKSLALTVDGVIDTIDVALFESADEYSREISTGKFSAQEFTGFLVRPQKYLAVAPYVRATDELGNISYGQGIAAPFTNVADRDYFFQQRDNPNLGLFVGKPIFSRVNQRWIWPFSRRLNKPDGTFAGVAYASLYVEQLEKILAQIKLDKGETISLRHTEFQLIAGRNQATRRYPIDVGDNYISPPFRQALQANATEGTYLSDLTKIDRTPRIFSYQRSAKYGFLVNVGIPGESALDEWRKQVWITAAFIGAFVLTAAVFAALIRRSWYLQEQDLVALNQAHDLANLGNFKVDMKSRLMSVSPSVYRILGVEPRDITNVASWMRLVKDTSLDEMRAYLNEVVERRLVLDREYQIVRLNDKQERWLHSKGKFQLDVNGEPLTLVGTVQDITERKLAEEEIRSLAYYDLLTGLPNRRLLFDRLTHALNAGDRSEQKGALLMLDLDNFKSLNDTRGHHVGDLLLKEVATRLSACVRVGDTVARLGGDEFVVMLEGLSSDFAEAVYQSEIVGKTVLKALNESYQLLGSAHHSSPSIGITLFSGRQHTADELMKRADTAMYQAKAAGRNNMQFFDPDMQRAIEAQVQVENDLRIAIAEGQFLLHYQAQVDSNDRILGAEALIRWMHPERGLVSPANFIQIAEKSGLILPIGRWVLETACSQLALWENDAHMAHLTLAVNVSARQFSLPNFIEDVIEVLDRTGARADRLKLELTEGLLLENTAEVIAKMTTLKERGVGFSLDDFGTGYSSLSYLKRLPLDQLKIDRSFVLDVLTDVNDAVIAQTVVALGHSLGLAVIAEGVETAEQRDFLSSIGCHVYQGYFFSKPLPIADFALYLKNRQQPKVPHTHQA
jgi:diguanylate cyclase (GGDEF)-like protein/PAS domain S-box-containing protein